MNQNTIVTFTIEGDPVEYKLQFDFNQICEAEAASGCNLMQALAGGGITAIQTRGLLYACLKPQHPLVLLSEAGDLLARAMPIVLEALGKTLADARGHESEPEEADVEESAG